MALTIIRKIELDHTAEEWDLYTHSMDCSEAARALNVAVMDAVNSSDSPSGAYNAAFAAFREYADFEAMDSEPLRMLDSILSKAYPGKWH